MAKQTWDTNVDVVEMLAELPYPVRRGKLLLFAVASCRRLESKLRRQALEFLDVAEAFAEGSSTVSQFASALTQAVESHSRGNNDFKGRNHPDRGGLVVFELIRALAGRPFDGSAIGLPSNKRAIRAALKELQSHLAHVHDTKTSFTSYTDARWRELEHQAHLLRDVVGPMSGPVAMEPVWRTETVVGLARGVHEDRAFERMPILADALQEAGCEDGRILDHCRASKPHVRGCWVIDDILRVPPARFKMTRVPTPSWAPTYALGEVKVQEVADEYGDAVLPAERDAMFARRAEILALADAQVEEYANDGCAPPDEDWFPEQAKMTGEFYIGRESYHKWVGADWCQICLKMRCIGKGLEGPDDYLGLDVWLRFEPLTGRLWVHRNPDSSVI